MKTSLIIPAFNEQNYIGQLLQSVATQTLIPNEVILCDNGSTDNTVAIATQFLDRLPLKIISEPKKGIIPAIETAWKSATGDLILRTDADCILPPRWVQNYVNHYQQNPSLSACGGSFQASDGHWFFRLITPIASDLNRIFLHFIRGYRILYGGNCSFKKSALIQINGYSTSEATRQDDLLISQKLHQHHLSYRFFADVRNYTSTRRFCSPKSTLLYLLSGLTPRTYQEKSS